MTIEKYETAGRILKDLNKLEYLSLNRYDAFLTNDAADDFEIWIKQEKEKLNKLLEEL
jgi:hypothetical protein